MLLYAAFQLLYLSLHGAETSATGKESHGGRPDGPASTRVVGKKVADDGSDKHPLRA